MCTQPPTRLGAMAWKQRMFERARTAILSSYHDLEGQLPPDEIDRRREVFLAKYAPNLLERLSGEGLLRAVHGDGPRSGLFYDLEFAQLYSPFGGIGGGSALKFKVYAAADGSGFRIKGPGYLPVNCSDAEAERMTADIVMLLCRACYTADEHQLTTNDAAAWREFERAVTSNLPSSLTQVGHDTPVALLGWAHKYLAICRPDVFSYHHHSRQLAGHLVRLGEAPEDGATRYLLDCQWRRLRTSDPDLRGCHPVLLMRAAYDTFGKDTGYWRINTDEHTEHGQIDRWPAMEEGGFVTIGWSSIADLSELLAGASEQEARDRIKQALSTVEEDLQPPARDIDRWAAQIHDFYAKLGPGDRIATVSDRQLLSVGEVTGEYEYVPGDVHPHRRSVTWYAVPGQTWLEPSGRRAMLADLSRSYPDALRMERLLQSSAPRAPHSSDSLLVQEAPYPEKAYTISALKQPAATIIEPLTAFEQRIKDILDRKGQVILYGPPGTGKTFSALRTARELAAREACQGRTWAMLTAKERQRAGESIELITLHPAYAYEDFIEGYRPASREDGSAFTVRSGIFLEVCDLARQNPGRHHILIIDEINRGNAAAIMGELITLLEIDKREMVEAVLPISRRRFHIPRNVWIIGTMNTADRSISMLDAALRRRFGFVEMLPEPGLIAVEIDGLPLSDLLSEINLRIRTYITRGARELQVGHAYFMRDGRPIGDKESLLATFRDEVLPLLAEYCFENYAMLARILGDEIIDVAGQVPNREVLRSADRLHEALLRLVASDTVPRPHSDEPIDDDSDDEPDFNGVGEADYGLHNPGTRRVR